MVAQVRRFNRIVTQRVGALNDRFLSRDRSLGEARVLWEIGARERDVRSLRTQLDLDSGYLSRLLRSLEATGLVTVGAKASDRRVRIASLTAAGTNERAVLDRRADELAAEVLEPLGAAQRARLVAAMAEVERLLTASMVEVESVDPSRPTGAACRARTSPSSTTGSTRATIPRWVCPPTMTSCGRRPACSCWRPCTVNPWAAAR